MIGLLLYLCLVLINLAHFLVFGCQAHLCYYIIVSLEFSSTNFRAYFIYFKYVFVLCFILFRIFFRNLVNRALLFSISFSTFCIYNCFASISLSWQLMVILIHFYIIALIFSLIGVGIIAQSASIYLALKIAFVVHDIFLRVEVFGVGD